MGQDQSTRKITIPNDDRFIKVSQSLADRLKNCPPEPTAGDPPVAEKCDPDAAKKERDFKVRNGTRSAVQDIGDEMIGKYYGPSLTALRVLQAKEEELAESEQYWSGRIQQQEKNHQNVAEIFNEEYEKTMAEIDKLMPRTKKRNKKDRPPCHENTTRIMQCLKTNPKEILRCSDEVAAFTQCIDGKQNL